LEPTIPKTRTIEFAALSAVLLLGLLYGSANLAAYGQKEPLPPTDDVNPPIPEPDGVKPIPKPECLQCNDNSTVLQSGLELDNSTIVQPGLEPDNKPLS